MNNPRERAAKIRQIGGDNEVDRFTVRQFGNKIANNQIANTVYSHLQNYNTDVILDFINRPPDKYGETLAARNQIYIYMGNHRFAKEAVATMVHESSHIDRAISLFTWGYEHS